MCLLFVSHYDTKPNKEWRLKSRRRLFPTIFEGIALRLLYTYRMNWQPDTPPEPGTFYPGALLPPA